MLLEHGPPRCRCLQQAISGEHRIALRLVCDPVVEKLFLVERGSERACFWRGMHLHDCCISPGEYRGTSLIRNGQPP